MSQFYYIGAKIRLIHEPDDLPMEDGIEEEVDEYDAHKEDLWERSSAQALDDTATWIARLPALAKRQAE